MQSIRITNRAVALSTVSSATPAAPSAPTPPTAPTPSTGATIVGQVSGTSSGAATGSSAVFRPQTTGLTVTVSGTAVSTTVDSCGAVHAQQRAARVT